MSKLQKLEEKVTTDNYQKFLFYLMQYNPFLALYFRRHKPSDQFINEIFATKDSNSSYQDIKTKLFSEITKNPKDLNKIAHMTKLIFGIQKVPGIVEDLVSLEWMSKKVSLKGFLFFDSFNEVNRTNVIQVIQKLEQSFDRWFFCKIYFPRATALNLVEQTNLVETLPEQKVWKAYEEEVKSLPHFAQIHSPYPKEQVSKYWPE